MSTESSELKRRLGELTKLHVRAVIAFSAAETLIKLSAPNVVGHDEAKLNNKAMNRYKGLFNTAFVAYNYELLMTLARIFVAHRDALYLEKLVNYAEQNRKKLTADDFEEPDESNKYLTELAARYEGLSNDDLIEVRDEFRKIDSSIKKLKKMRDESLAHVNLAPPKMVSLTPQEMADLITLSEKVLNLLSTKYFQTASYFKLLEEEPANDILSLVALARLENENRQMVGELLDQAKISIGFPESSQ